MKLKICGMKYQENMEAVAALQPDYLGFIFYEKSSRYFHGEMGNIPANIKKTGVFVNATLEEIQHKIAEFGLKVIQLHGDESVDFCKKLKTENSSIEIIKVFSIKDDFDFEQLHLYKAFVDYFLFDTKGKLPGGNGYTFNWKVLQNYNSEKPYFLSGGIGLETIPQLQEFIKSPEAKKCTAIDVNSKFETQPGLKNIEELQLFIEQLQLATIN
ncbi:phosphoribosylanthranilate isomerase [Zhouia sp. PK063]|uniref:phosphoribosylanthranilate isomerase n=1 Tax=Zhouia sp. PK063 TaxID=3373602 RepID=UPI0037A1E7DE